MRIGTGPKSSVILPHASLTGAGGLVGAGVFGPVFSTLFSMSGRKAHNVVDVSISAAPVR